MQIEDYISEKNQVNIYSANKTDPDQTAPWEQPHQGHNVFSMIKSSLKSTWPLGLIHSPLLIWLSISSEFGSNSFKKNQFKKFVTFNALGSEFVMVNFGSSFEQTWLVPHLKCYIPSPKVINLLVLEKKIYKEVLRYMGIVVILVVWPGLFV